MVLEDHDTAAARILPVAQRAQDAPPVERQSLPQPIAKRCECVPVRPSVGHEEENVTRASVADLERDPPPESLAVGEPRLGLYVHQPSSTANLGVPGPQVPLDRQRHFRAPAQAWVQLAPKAVEQRGVGSIPERIAGGVRADREFQPNDRTARREEIGRRRIDLPSLKATELASRYARAVRRELLAQPASDARFSDVSAHSPGSRACRPSSAVRGPLSCRHDREAWQGALYSPFSSPSGRPTAQTTTGAGGWAVSDTVIRGLGPPAAQTPNERGAWRFGGSFVRPLGRPAAWTGASGSSPR